MSKLPTVAIIGRPNTGKSTLFNRFIGHRKAIVSDVPGTTRDHVAGKVETEEIDFLLVDTGGMGGGTKDIDLEDDVHQQSLLALANADLILFTVNSREDLTASDMNIVDSLRKKKKKHVPVIIVVTKCDNMNEVDELLPEFHAMGIAEEVIPISAPHKIGIDTLLQSIAQQLTALHFRKNEEETEQSFPKIAFVGKPNVGKSSIVNAFMSEAQQKTSPLLVSEIAGTTRDTTDTIISCEGQQFCFMDTAGIKRRNQTEGDIDVHAYFRSVRALELCDIAILVLDSTKPVSKQDKRIAGMAIEEGKGLVILANKWDLVSKEEREKILVTIRESLAFCTYAPILPCSAKERTGLLKLFPLIEMVQRNRTRRLATKELNRWFEDVIYGQPLGPISKSKLITQSEDLPPTFVIFVKNPKQVQVSQLRFLDNRLRETFDFQGTPVRWVTKSGHK